MRRAPDEEDGEEGPLGRVESLSDGADEGAVGEEDEDADRRDVFEIYWWWWWWWSFFCFEGERERESGSGGGGSAG